MNKKLFPIVSLSILLLLPIVAVAAGFDAGNRPPTNVAANNATILAIITNTFNLLWLIFVAFAIVMFLVAGFQFLAAQGEPDGVKKAQKSVLWGAIGVALGILAFLIPFIIGNWVLVPAA